MPGRVGKMGREEDGKSEIKKKKGRNLRITCITYKNHDSNVSKADMRNYAMHSFHMEQTITSIANL